MTIEHHPRPFGARIVDGVKVAALVFVLIAAGTSTVLGLFRGWAPSGLIDAVPVPRVAHDGLLARAEAADRGAVVARARPTAGDATFDRADTFDRPDTFDRAGEERSA